MDKFKHFMKETGSVVLLAIVLAAALKLFIVDSRVVPSSSMYPTVHAGDRVLINKIGLRFSELKRRDIIVFRIEGEKYDLLKRVIALPGERVRVEGGLVYINDEPLDEPYLAEAPAYTFAEVTVPEGCLFVLGDNRNKSSDSHYWADPFVTIDSVKGKAFCCYWPLNRIGAIVYKGE